MIRAVVTGCVAFALCAALGAELAACSSTSDCECPDVPARPQAQEALGIEGAASYDSHGNAAELPIAPQGGTLTVDPDAVTIRYEQDGVQHEVVYEVVPNR